MYPNPTNTEGGNFEFNKTSAADWHVMIYNNLGQIISLNPISASVGNTNHCVTFDKTLPNGTYFYNLIDENSLIRNAGKVALSR